MYSAVMEDQRRQAIDAINDHDARTFIVRTGKRVDVSEGLGDDFELGGLTDDTGTSLLHEMPNGGGVPMNLLVPEPTKYDVLFWLFGIHVRISAGFWIVHLLLGVLFGVLG